MFDKAEDITHAKNTRGDTVRMKWFEHVDLFAYTDELDRFLRNFPHRKGCSATGIAVHFGQDNTVNTDLIVKLFRNVHCILSGHGISNEQYLSCLKTVLNILEFCHKRFIDMKPACSVNDENIIGLCPCLLECLKRNCYRISGVA